MDVMEYIRMTDRFGRKFEKAIAVDFPGDAELAATVNSALSKITFGVLSSFYSRANDTTTDKEKK